MIALLPLAFAAGVLTATATCIVPVLPGIVGGSLGRSRMRPLGIVAGLVVSFTIFGTAFAIFLDFLGLSKGTVRIGAIALLFLFGVALAVPALYEWIVVKGTLMWRKFHNPPQPSLTLREGSQSIPPLRVRGGEEGLRSRNGFWGSFGIGATLGAVWTPCAGPILGAILTLAATTQNVLQSGILFFTYALGAAVPMLLIGYGGRALVLRIKGFVGASARIRQVSGVILVIWAIALWFGVDRYFQAYLTDLIPEPAL